MYKKIISTLALAASFISTKNVCNEIEVYQHPKVTYTLSPYELQFYENETQQIVAKKSQFYMVTFYCIPTDFQLNLDIKVNGKKIAELNSTLYPDSVNCQNFFIYMDKGDVMSFTLSADEGMVGFFKFVVFVDYL